VNRRELIALLASTAAAWPVGICAQGERTRRIGILFGGFRLNDPEPQARLAVLQEALAQLGWVDGRICASICALVKAMPRGYGPTRRT
jgi:hypothetical protein